MVFMFPAESAQQSMFWTLYTGLTCGAKPLILEGPRLIVLLPSPEPLPGESREFCRSASACKQYFKHFITQTLLDQVLL